MFKEGLALQFHLHHQLSQFITQTQYRGNSRSDLAGFREFLTRFEIIRQDFGFSLLHTKE